MNPYPYVSREIVEGVRICPWCRWNSAQLAATETLNDLLEHVATVHRMPPAGFGEKNINVGTGYEKRQVAYFSNL